MIEQSFYDANGIDNFISQINFSNIPLITTLKIDNAIWARFDTVINRYYRGQMKYLKLLLAHNNISDVSKVKIGQIIEIPDFDFLENYLRIIDFDNTKVAGVCLHTDNYQENLLQSINQQKNSKITIASKLQIPVKKTEYNPTTGDIIF